MGAAAAEPFRRLGCRPNILAYFNAEGVLGHFGMCKYKPRTERSGDTGNINFRVLLNASARRKLPLLIKLGIIRHIGFRNNAEDFAALQNGCAVIKL